MRLLPPLSRPLVLLALLPAALVACAQKPQPPSMPPFAAYSDDGAYLPPAGGPGLVASSKSPIADVPMPIGFAPVPSRSSSSAGAGGARRVHHVYQGRASAVEVMQYYKQTLWQYRWKWLGWRKMPHGGLQQGFVKGPEELTITATQKPGVVAQSIATVSVDIGPRGAAPGPAASGSSASSGRAQTKPAYAQTQTQAQARASAPAAAPPSGQAPANS